MLYRLSYRKYFLAGVEPATLISYQILLFVPFIQDAYKFLSFIIINIFAVSVFNLYPFTTPTVNIFLIGSARSD